MKLKHKVPCSECPWRRLSAAGWLGGYEPEFYADAVQENEVPACHNKDFGPRDGRTAMCAGALSTIKQQCIDPYKQDGGKAAADSVGHRDDCFSNVREFYHHHKGEDYVLRILRSHRN